LRAVDHFPGCTFVRVDQLVNHVLKAILDLLANEQAGAQPRGTAGFPYVGLVAGMLAVLVAPVAADQWAKTLGVSIAAPLVLAGGGFALALVYARYFCLLGASDAPAGSRDRQGYDALRDNLITGGPATHLYARWLTAFLGRVDRFFGDAGMADRTLFPHAFGLRTPAPLWTVPAFDRCLLLALLYPIVTIFIMWAASGDVGPAEEALGLRPSLSGWQRGISVAAIGFSVFASRQFVHASGGWIRLVWLSFTVAFAGAGAFGGAFGGTFGGAVAGAVAGAFIGAGAGVVALALAGAFAVAATGAGALGLGLAGAFAVAVAFAWLSDAAIDNQRQGVFLLSFVFAMTAGCMVAAHALASLTGWHAFGPLLLFLVLLTLLNAPFDWASLGLTRALLRRGLELKGWWPFFLAVADALAAIVIVALLALTMVIGVQTFDALAVHGGGKAVLPLAPLFDGIATHPEAPEFWWVYALLISTMIPSLINLAIGGTALMRAVPGLPQILLYFLPAMGGVRSYDRAWIAAVLTAQAALGAVLGVAVQALVAWVFIFHAMPAAGLGLLDLARGLAALDLPTRAIAFFTGP
jgi:hypothetical protein